MVLQKGKHMIVMELIRISNILNSNISGVILGRKYLNLMSNDYQFYVVGTFQKGIATYYEWFHLRLQSWPLIELKKNWNLEKG